MTSALQQESSLIDSNDSSTNRNLPRTIDDFLDELYLAYKKRFMLHDDINVQPNVVTPQHQQNLTECITDVFLRIIRTVYELCFVNKCRAESSFSYHRYLPPPLLALCIANSSDATEILMLSYLLANPTFRRDMFEDDGGSNIEGAQYLASSIFLGMLLGGTVIGFMSDSFGRKPTLLTGLLLNASAGTLSSIPFITPSFKELTVLRFIAGIGIGATVPPLFSLASEWSPKAIRGSVVTAVASFWMVGSIFVSGVAWCLFQSSDSPGRWRIFAALCSLPSAVGAMMVYQYVPESPRFLASKHNCKQAAHSCNQMVHTLEIAVIQPEAYTFDKLDAKNRESIAPLLLVSATELEPMYKNETLKTDPSNATKSIYMFFETLRKLYSRQLLSQTTMPLQSLWFSLSFGTYGITTWINSLFVAIHLENLYLNSFLFALANLPGNAICILYSDDWGRKRMLVGSLIGAASSLALFAVLVYVGSGSEQSNSWIRTDAIVLFACAFQMFSIISWNTIDIISGELFPTRVRSAGVGVCTASGRMGAMVAQVANAKLMIHSSNSDKEDGSPSIASAWVLVIASSALLFGAFMPIFLGRDASGGELKDELEDIGQSSTVNRLVACGWKSNKDHLSDEEVDANGVSAREKSDVLHVLEYDSFRQEVEANQPFLL